MLDVEQIVDDLYQRWKEEDLARIKDMAKIAQSQADYFQEAYCVCRWGMKGLVVVSHMTAVYMKLKILETLEPENERSVPVPR